MRRPLWCAPAPSASSRRHRLAVSRSRPITPPIDVAPTPDAPVPVPSPSLLAATSSTRLPADAFDKTHAPPADDPGDTLCGVRLGFDGVFAALSALTIVLISASCYFEEWMYKVLPGFNYFWTVAFAELLVFSVMSIAGALATGTLGALLRDRKAPLYKYVLQAAVMAVYAAVAKIAYKYLNYATATVLRSSKLVFVMAISVAWLGRKYSAVEYASAVAMIAAVACFGLGGRAPTRAARSRAGTSSPSSDSASRRCRPTWRITRCATTARPRSRTCSTSTRSGSWWWRRRRRLWTGERRWSTWREPSTR